MSSFSHDFALIVLLTAAHIEQPITALLALTLGNRFIDVNTFYHIGNFYHPIHFIEAGGSMPYTFPASYFLNKQTRALF
jgi:hypothetical protein